MVLAQKIAHRILVGACCLAGIALGVLLVDDLTPLVQFPVVAVVFCLSIFVGESVWRALGEGGHLVAGTAVRWWPLSLLALGAVILMVTFVINPERARQLIGESQQRGQPTMVVNSASDGSWRAVSLAEAEAWCQGQDGDWRLAQLDDFARQRVLQMPKPQAGQGFWVAPGPTDPVLRARVAKAEERPGEPFTWSLPALQADTLARYFALCVRI